MGKKELEKHSELCRAVFLALTLDHSGKILIITLIPQQWISLSYKRRIKIVKLELLSYMEGVMESLAREDKFYLEGGDVFWKFCSLEPLSK